MSGTHHVVASRRFDKQDDGSLDAEADFFNNIGHELPSGQRQLRGASSRPACWPAGREVRSFRPFFSGSPRHRSAVISAAARTAPDVFVFSSPYTLRRHLNDRGGSTAHSCCYRTHDDARGNVFDYIERFYNTTQRHSTSGYLSPAEF
jgi:hypothetical protein